MDLLKSLRLDELPEQQTRTAHLIENHPNFQLSLGFDSCCVCGKSDPLYECELCHRIKYCSSACRAEDSDSSKRRPRNDGDEEEEDHALGHSAVICALLRVCNDDEAVERASGGNTLDDRKRLAAIDRLASEYESFPATLANILIDGPCFQNALYNRRGGTLTVHIVGASHDGELWCGHPEPSQKKSVFRNYAEALVELAERHDFKTIELSFVGPECPSENLSLSVSISVLGKRDPCSALLVTTHCGNYDTKRMHYGQMIDPDIVVFFNPGFTCPDYDWNDALSCIKEGTPLLVTTNTELEGVADIQYLIERKLIKTIPSGLEEMLDISSCNDRSVNSDNDSFFSVNPYCGNRVRQSGTMANDLYVKNRWILGTTLGRSCGNTVEQPAKRLKIVGSGNTKKANPALV